MPPRVGIISSFALVHIGAAEWCTNSFDAPYATKPWGGFVNCQEEAAGGHSHCWHNSLMGFETLLAGCRKACSKCEPSGADICDEASWPDKAHGIVCGECKVLVPKSEHGHQTCAGYCASLGLPCTGVWEGLGDTCAVKHEMTCYQSLPSSGAICECNPAADVTGGMPDDNDDGVVGWMSMRLFVASLLPLLCLGMFRFFIWKRTVTNSTQSIEKSASNVVVGNLIQVSTDRASEDIEKSMARQPLLS